MKNKVIISTLVALFTLSIPVLAFTGTLRGTKDGNRVSFQAETTANQSATHCSVAVSVIDFSDNNHYITSAADDLRPTEGSRALDAKLNVNGYNAGTSIKGLLSEHYANEYNDYQEDVRKGTYDSSGNLRLVW